MVCKPNDVNNSTKGQPSTGTVAAHLRTLRANGRAPYGGYLDEGCPEESLAPENSPRGIGKSKVRSVYSMRGKDF